MKSCAVQYPRNDLLENILNWVRLKYGTKCHPDINAPLIDCCYITSYNIIHAIGDKNLAVAACIKEILFDKKAFTELTGYLTSDILHLLYTNSDTLLVNSILMRQMVCGLTTEQKEKYTKLVDVMYNCDKEIMRRCKLMLEKS